MVVKRFGRFLSLFLLGDNDYIHTIYPKLKMKTFVTLSLSAMLIGSVWMLSFQMTSPRLEESGISTRWPSLKEYKLTWEGYERSYWLYTPTARKLSPKVPVVFVIHGGGGYAQNMPKFTKKRFHRLADREGFLVVYPQGYGNQWNDGRDPQRYASLRKHPAFQENLDDVGFFMQILNELDRKHKIDRRKVFACGNSNGGFMSNRLICDRPDVFRGVGVITATMDIGYLPNCNPDRPAGLVIMNGTKDGGIPYEGGKQMVYGIQRGEVLSTDDYASFWVKHNKCQTQKPNVHLPDQDGDGTHVTIQEYTDCEDRSRVVLYTIHEGGHTWPGAKSLLYEMIAGKTTMEINACDILWEFFKTL